jgi:hypothetical protein
MSGLQLKSLYALVQKSSIVSGNSKISGGLRRNLYFGKNRTTEYRRLFDIKASTAPTTALRSWIAHNRELAAQQFCCEVNSTAS